MGLTNRIEPDNSSSENGSPVVVRFLIRRFLDISPVVKSMANKFREFLLNRRHPVLTSTVLVKRTEIERFFSI